MTAGELPEGRYGPSRRPRSRWARPLWLVLALLTGLAAAVLGYHNLGPSPIETDTVSFALLPDRPAQAPGPGAPSASDAPPPNGHAVSLRFQVRRDDPAHPAVCIVRARSLDGEETGRREVYVPPGSGPVELTTTIRTSRPPVTADVYGCSMRVPSYLVPGTGP